jgi:predicted transcriptional regulator
MPAKTEELPGIEGEGVSPKKIKKLDNAIAGWRENVKTRMEWTRKEVESRDKVMQIMRSEGVVKYSYQESDDEKKIVELDVTEKLKFKNAADAEESAEAGEGDGD